MKLNKTKLGLVGIALSLTPLSGTLVWQNSRDKAHQKYRPHMVERVEQINSVLIDFVNDFVNGRKVDEDFLVRIVKEKYAITSDPLYAHFVSLEQEQEKIMQQRGYISGGISLLGIIGSYLLYRRGFKEESSGFASQS